MATKLITYLEAVNDYLSDCELLKHLRPSTVRVYRITLLDFAKHCPAEGHCQLSEVSRDTWVGYMVARDHLANKSYNAVLSRLTGFHKWCYRKGYMQVSDEPLGVISAKADVNLREKSFLQPEHLEAVLAAAEEWHPRDRALVAALWLSGRRGGELLSMKVGDVDFKPYPRFPSGKYIYDNHKAGRLRQSAPLDPDFHALLAGWLETYTELLGRAPKPAEYLFPGLKVDAGSFTLAGQRRRLKLDPSAQPGHADDIVRRALRGAGVYREGMAAHSLRRGGADNLYRRAAQAGHPDPLRVVKTFLDHRDTQMTEKYLDKSKDVAELSDVLHQLAGAASGPAESTSPAEPEQAITETAPEPAGSVVSLAQWKSSKAG